MSQQGANLPQEVKWSQDQATVPHGSTPDGLGSATMKPAGSNSSSSSISKLASKTDNAGSMLVASPAVPHAGEDNDAGSKIASPAVPHAGEDNNAGTKIAIQAVPHAGEDNNAVSKVVSPGVLLHAGEDKDNNTRSSKLAIPAVLHAGEDNNAVSKLAIQAAPRGGEGNNAGSKPASPATVDAGKRNSKEGKSDVAGEGGGAASKASKRSTSNASKRSTSNASKSAKNLSVHGGGVRDVVKDAPAAVTDGGSGSGKGKGAAAPAATTDNGLHIWTERERRKKMKNMFSTLHALLPQLPDKADKATIVGEAITYIQTLEGTVQKLEQLKLERKRAQEAQRLSAAVGGGSSSAAAARHPAPAASREATLADTVRGWNAQQAPKGGSSAAAAPPFQTWAGPNIVVSVAGNEGYINLSAPRQPRILTKLVYVLERHRIDVVTSTVSTDEGGHKSFIIHGRITRPSNRFGENVTHEERFKLAVSEMLHLMANCN